MKKLIICISCILAGCSSQEQVDFSTLQPPSTINYEQKAFLKYFDAERSNDPVKINALGVMYEYGFGISKNIEKAKDLYLKSGKLGYGSGYYNLGLISIENGVSEYKKAIDYFYLAAGSPIKNNIGYRGLGDAYFYGYGVKPDLDKAKEFYLYAIQLGDTSGFSEQRLGALEEFQNNTEEANRWYNKAYEKGYRENKSFEENMISILKL